MLVLNFINSAIYFHHYTDKNLSTIFELHSCKHWSPLFFFHSFFLAFLLPYPSLLPFLPFSLVFLFPCPSFLLLLSISFLLLLNLPLPSYSLTQIPLLYCICCSEKAAPLILCHSHLHFILPHYVSGMVDSHLFHRHFIFFYSSCLLSILRSLAIHWI